MKKIGSPVRITKEGLLVIRSIKSYEECKKYGKSYEWSVTLYLYSSNKEHTQKFFGLSDPEYLYWIRLLAKKSLQNRKRLQDEKEKNKKQFNLI